MSEGTFSTQAGVLWGTIAREARERILKNVFCGKCRGSVEMVRFTGEEEKGDVILKGCCATGRQWCGWWRRRNGMCRATEGRWARPKE